MGCVIDLLHVPLLLFSCPISATFILEDLVVRMLNNIFP